MKMVDLGPLERAALGREAMEWVESRCLCPGCPAYPKADAGQKKAYCLRGDSAHKADIEPKDCHCESCEIYKHGRLYGNNFYCLEGVALEQGLRNLLQGRPITTLADEKRNPRPALFISNGLDVHEP